MTPQSEAELAEMIAEAKGPLSVTGGGTRAIAGGAVPLSIAGLSGVSLYEPGALTLVVKAGTPLSQITSLLDAENQRLAFEPMDHRGLLGTDGDATIGGVFAANISGPRRIQCGAARDFLLGVRFVDGRGQRLSNGGRVMKNVTGYDLVKLMCGAHGTLGVLSEVSLKVLPKAEAVATVTVEIAEVTKAVAAMSKALGSPYDVTGAAYDPERGTVHIRVEGFEASVAYRAGALCQDLASFGAAEVSGEDAALLWQRIRDVAAFHDRPGDVWRISVKPTDAVHLASKLDASALQFDWGGGLIWALMPPGQDLRAQMTVPGHATLVRADAATRARIVRFQPEPAPLAAVSAGLRAQFDPRGILNPGLMG
ncbi:FAD-binding protein [Phaeobacter sp.]|uniref:FAD-binding protein n=1 Tax=Phaeobacter sp. TaxID=1902409 RepID=UPI0025F7732A|nr:FAD-binding protein [Phaeobacter sp.]